MIVESTSPGWSAARAAGDSVRRLRARAVDVPLPRPIKTGAGSVTSAPLVLIDVETASGVGGRAYLFCYTLVALRAMRALLQDMEQLVVGLPAAPRTVTAALQNRFRLLGVQGLAAMAISGIDMALWDATAVAHGVPLCVLLGANVRAVPAYDSLGMMSVADALDEASRSLGDGFEAIKYKISGGRADDDVAFVSAVRAAVGPAVDLMVDYNQSLDRGEAIRRGNGLAAASLRWIEEPCRAEDDEAHAAVALAVETPIQIGENWWGPDAAYRSISRNACDEMMLDVMKIGGVSGWLDAAALGAASGRRISSHIFPEISAHLLAATPAARYLEWLDLASPILRTPMRPNAGTVMPSDEPGTGIAWNEEAVDRYQIS